MLESLHNNLFTYKKLTEDEQHQRGILGRLVGIIADTKAPTRNGRLYGEDLWENVFKDPIMLEKIENRCCFGELGHPLDREEVDPEKIAICLAEIPKKGKDGKLYGVFDILNTPCGKILKSLCDYGTNIGVSSRGSGDIMANDEVDPDTYCCECWDAVLIPAVKAARQQYVTEAIDTKALKLRKALTESYNCANDEDKKIMKETLDGLGINLDNEKLTEDLPEEEIPWAEHEENFELVEDADEDIDEEDVEEEDIEEDEDEADSEEANEEEPEVQTVGDFVKSLKEFDKELELEFKPIVINDVEYEVNGLDLDDSEDGKLIVNIGYNSEMSDNKEVDEEPEIEDEEEAAEVEEIAEEPIEETEEADDDGVEEVIESLKEMIRQKDELENEVKNLKSRKTVDDVEVKKLKEELDKYKSAYARTSVIAAEAKEAKVNVQKLTTDVQKLTEELNKKNSKIKELESVKANTVALTESANSNELKVKKLTEALNSKQKELESKDAQLTEQKSTLTKQINEKIEVAKKYRAQLNEAVNKYIETKANMLGVRTTEITSRLDNKFSMNDIDKVCEKLLKESVNFNRLPIGADRGLKVRFTEQPKQATPKSAADGYDIDDSLLVLAGLK